VQKFRIAERDGELITNNLKETVVSCFKIEFYRGGQKTGVNLKENGGYQLLQRITVTKTVTIFISVFLTFFEIAMFKMRRKSAPFFHDSRYVFVNIS
jgi:hypothetical protein